MEHGARLSTSRVMAIAFIFMSVLIVLSLSVNVIQGVNNYRLQNEQRTAVTPMAFNAPFAVSQNSADASYLQQMALSFIALRLNVSSETVDASHQALLQYIRPGAQNQMKVILAEEAKRIKNDNVNSAFFQTSVRVWPQYGRVEIRGVLKTWIGDSKPFTDIKHYILILKRENGVTGSLVFGPNGEITPLSARTTDRSIIRAMMEGGTAKIYHCNDSDKCLKVVADTPVTISRDNALKSQITKLLASIQNKAVSDTPLDDKEKGFISSTTIPVFKYLVDPQMLGVSNSMIYQLTDYIGYDILLQYIQELIQQARAMVATGNYDEAVIGHINDNMNDATRQIAAFQSQVQVQQDALLVVDRQMSYMRQQLSARMLSRYQNNYHFGGSTR
ncbi:type IV conjugative transfer system protein TraE [Escherichia coli]|nr:type IV conjugative transfer system protein TraE [Escherichia coli]MDN0762310.1 type IV conjugative transfer system protein TraE [Escherichia coli]HAJ3740541.1 type IV conjugative transfer system protein TraE [Escherichia coli]HAJ3755843.1 type IV conjugative transfer system protein TraE [Escherichia coli]HBA3160863.1 type IV conjugative transfer system protein TraE [Escherichia coli]